MSTAQVKNDASSSILPIIYYNLRCGFYQAAVDEAVQSLKSHSKNDGEILFWKACAIGLSGLHAEAIRELEAMRQSYRQIDFAIITALIWLHRQSVVTDEDELERLELMLKAARDCVYIDGALLASRFHLNTGSLEDTLLCLKLKAFQRPNIDSNKEVEAEKARIRLWLRLCCTEYHDYNPASDLIVLKNEIINGNYDIDSLMVQTEYFVNDDELLTAVEHLNKAIASNKHFYPALIEKAKLHLKLRQFSQAQESAQRSISESYAHIEALRVLTLVQYISGNDRNQRLENLRRMLDLATSAKNLNMNFCYETSQIFARLAGKDETTLTLTSKLIANVCDLDPSNVDFRIELAFQHCRLKRYDEAIVEYQFASSLDTSNTEVLKGMILCHILKGDIEGAKQQMEFVALMEDSCAKSTDLSYANVLLEGYHDSVGTHFKQLIDTAMNIMIAQTDYNRGCVYDYVRFDFALALDIAELFRDGQYGEYILISSLQTNTMKDIFSMLSLIVKWCPAFVEGWLVMSKIMLQQNQVNDAAALVEECIVTHSHSATAHLLHAQIQMELKDEKMAQQCLEQALSENFRIRTHPIFCLVKSTICVSKALWSEAKELLECATYSRMINDGTDRDCITSLYDRVSCFVQLGSILKSLQCDEKKIASLVSSAIRKFKETPQFFRILKFRSDLLLEDNNVEGALKVFNGISQESLLFRAVQITKAEIYLQKLHDMDRFIQCHECSVKLEKTSQSYLSLGEAYTRIQRPKQAVEAYQTALNLDPEDEQLALKIGSILLSNHDYQKAVDHYGAYLQKKSNSRTINIEYANLHMNLRNFDKAIEIYTNIMHNISSDQRVQPQSDERVNILIKIADVYEMTGELNKQKVSLTEAKNIQIKQLSNASKNIRSLKNQEMEKTAVLLLRNLAKCFEKEGDISTAKDLYIEALEIFKYDVLTLVSISKLFLRQNKYESCQLYCEKLLQVQPDSLDAILTLGSLLTFQNLFEDAISHYKSFLKNQPRSYEVLIECVWLLHRLDRIEEVDNLLNDDVMGLKSLSSLAGFSVCKALQRQCVGDFTKALEYFNTARHDPKWGSIAVQSMIKIYLHISRIDFWILKKPRIDIAETLRTVDILLNEINTDGEELRVEIQLLRGYCQLFSALETGIVDKSVKTFTSILDIKKDHIPSLLGLAMSYTVCGAQAKFRNMLKRIAKIPYQMKFWQEFENSYILLAQIYHERGKHDMAEDLCKRCLFYNKSSTKAWEKMGDIMEKQQQSKEAAKCYSKCWTLSETQCPIVGYKLAAQYLKGNNVLDAIEVSDRVLELAPSHPTIRKDVLEKCILLICA